MEYAVKSRELASNSTFKKASAKNVMRDTQSLMENAKESITLSQAILAALFGLQASVKPAQKDGSSMPTTSAHPSATSVPPGMKSPETAKHATMDLSFKREDVSSTLIPALSPSQTFYVTFGWENNVWNAPKEASSMLMASVSQSVLSVIPSIRPQETA